MPAQTKTKLRSVVRWILWVLLVQLLLANISAALYAYKFTHYYEGPMPARTGQNIFGKTWRLFAGPRFYKMSREEEPSFPFQNISFKTVEGISIDGWYSKVDSAKGCVVLLHGVTVNKSYLTAEAGCFRNWGYNVLLIDFRGHGKSEGHNGSFGVKETGEVEQAVAFAKTQGNKKIILYGISLGAAVSLKAASDGKIKPDAVIADMPFGSLHHHLRSRAVETGFPAEPFATLVTLWMGMERGYNGFHHDVSDYVQSVHCPVLLQWGDQDQYVSRDEMDKVYSKLASGQKKIVTYAGAGHEALLSVDPLKWQREVLSFLSTVP
jgi:pimeloyl-ACP methyl ester carboxylesterase